MSESNSPTKAISPTLIVNDTAEGVQPKVASKPVLPTAEEVELHNAVHIPYRSCCVFCVAGKEG